MNSKKAIKFLVATLVVFISIKANAQQGWRMGFSINPGYAIQDPNQLVLGADVRLQKDLNSKSNFLIITSGITHFFDNSKTIDGFTYVPVKAGIKSFLGKNFYVAGEVGAGLTTNKGAEHSFLWSPSIGYSLRKIDLSIKYEDYVKYDGLKQIAVRIAYGFKL